MMSDWIKENRLAFIIAVVFHVLILGALFINWQMDKPEKIVMEQGDIIQVTSVDANSYEAEIKKIEQKKQAVRRLERQRIEKQRKAEALKEKKKKQARLRKTEEEKRNKAAAAKKKKADQTKKRKEAEKKAAEAKRKKEQKKHQEELKQKELEQQHLKEQRLKEKKFQEAEKKRKAEQEKRQAELKRQEERAIAERKRLSKGIVNRHVAMIAQKIERNWRQPLDAPSNLKCKIDIVLLPSGKVVSVKVVDSSGNPSFDRSVETAVRRASPLPVPTDSVIFKQFEVMRLRFEPGH